MKRSIEIISLVLLFVAAQSCTDVLQRAEPSTSTTQEVALGTPAGVKAVRAGMYTGLFAEAYNKEYMLAPSTLADGLYARPGNTRGISRNQNTEGVIAAFWEASYAGITDNDVPGIIQMANLLIGAVKEEVIPPDLLTQYKAEAYFMRAFAFHNLARAFSYEPNSIPNNGKGAGFNLGIVLRTEPALSPEDIEYKGRATVKETYKQIESDLLTSIELFSQVKGADKPRYATRAAAEALLARVYLYWEKWQKADKYAGLAMQHSPAHLAEPSQMGSLFLDPGTTIEVIFRGYIADPLNAVNEPQNNGKAAYTSKQWVAQVPTQDQMDLYSNDDARLAWFRPCFDELDDEILTCRATHPAVNADTPASEKRGLELAKWDGSLSDKYSDHIPYFRTPEMLLIQAESRLKGAPGSAAAPLNKLRNSRGLSDYNGTITMETILKARRREFIGEGQRYWDLKRLRMNIRKAPGTLNDVNMNIVPYTAYRILNDIPDDVVAVSKANAPDSAVIKQNPGY